MINHVLVAILYIHLTLIVTLAPETLKPLFKTVGATNRSQLMINIHSLNWKRFQMKSEDEQITEQIEDNLVIDDSFRNLPLLRSFH